MDAVGRGRVRVGCQRRDVGSVDFAAIGALKFGQTFPPDRKIPEQVRGAAWRKHQIKPNFHRRIRMMQLIQVFSESLRRRSRQKPARCGFVVFKPDAGQDNSQRNQGRCQNQDAARRMAGQRLAECSRGWFHSAKSFFEFNLRLLFSRLSILEIRKMPKTTKPRRLTIQFVGMDNW